MKILVTGNMGFIGSKLQAKLQREGHIVLGIDKNGGDNLIDPNIEFPEVDLVYHLAAQTSVMDSMTNFQEDALDNIIGTLAVIKAYPKTRIIYTTSAASINPISPYGISKMVGELYIKTLLENYVICRLPNIYDVKGKSIISKIKNDSTITFYGDGVRDYVHVNDIVNGLLKARYWQTSEYSLGSGARTPLKNLMQIAIANGKDVLVANQRKGEQYDSTIPNTTPDWQPTHSLSEIL